jgi:hypothetical protein
VSLGNLRPALARIPSLFAVFLFGDDESRMSNEKPSKLTAYFWVRDQFLPETECSPADASVLSALAGYGNPDGTSIRPGNPRLMATTKLSKSQIKLSIDRWLRHPSGVLVEVSPGCGRKHAAVFRIRMFAVESKGVHGEPLYNEEKGQTETPLDEKGGRKGVSSDVERGQEWGQPLPPTEVPSITESSSVASASTSSSYGTSDDDLKFSKAKTDFLAKAPGPKDELAEALDLIRDRARDNGNKPIRNWPAYFKESLANFLDSDWKAVRDRLARAAKARSLSSPEAKAKAQRLHKTAIDRGWTDLEFGSLLHHDFGQPIQPTVASIAQLSEWNYLVVLTRFQQPPPSICTECGQRGCEHLRTERERFVAECRQLLRDKGQSHE